VKKPALVTAVSAVFLVAAFPLSADTIYQINALGKRVVIQRQAIVIQDDSTYVVYKHFDLKDQRVERVRLDQGSLPYEVETSSPEERQRIVGIWKAFGPSGTVTDSAGKTTRVYDLYIDFYPPGGRGSLLESVPAMTSVPLQLDSGAADVVPFSNILKMVFEGPELHVTLRDGRSESGRFLMPTEQPAEARLLGITDKYVPDSHEVFDFSLPLARIKEVTFQH
jgi:hypothetical protein